MSAKQELTEKEQKIKDICEEVFRYLEAQGLKEEEKALVVLCLTFRMILPEFKKILGASHG